jgi:RES domain-containing protein
LPEGEPARTLHAVELPPAWWTDAAATTTRDLGDAWIRDRSSLALLVPSVPIRAEWNVLINPLHPRIGELQIDPPQPFLFDARMFQQAQR